MYKEIKDGTLFVFGNIECWAPPPPVKSKILFSNLSKKDQKWKRSELPDFWKELRPEEKRLQRIEWKKMEKGEMEEVVHFNPILEAYRREQWKMRLDGVHIMVNGNLIYLTGPWWYYLQWCKFDHEANDGYPNFYISQRKRYYFRQSCYEIRTCLGYFFIGARGFGKTTEEVGMIVESMTRAPKRRRAALQSKTGDDSKNVIFKGKVVPLYKSLPDFFKPNSNHGTNPENKLSLFLDSKRGEKAKDLKMNIAAHELENTIFHVSAKVKALDGETLAEIMQDEIGKTDPKKEANVYDRIHVNRFSVFRNNIKVGMIRATTTVEEMAQGGKECQMVWKESDQRHLTDNGFTLSGLYRIFVGALETATQFADEYGYIDEEKAMKYHMHEREMRKHNSHALSSWIRKNPIYEEESFIKDASQSVFNVFILTERLQELHTMKRMPYLKGNFYWVDGKIDGEVAFREDEHAGRFYVAKLLDSKGKKDAQPGEIFSNQMTSYVNPEGKRQWVPQNNKRFRMGGDPIKYSKTKDPRASKMAMHGFELYNHAIDSGNNPPKKQPNDPDCDWETYNYIFEYIHRPEDPEIAYEDCIMAIRYYGMSFLPETNIKELAKHLKDRGYDDCVIYRRDFDADFVSGQQDDAGVASTNEIIHSYVTSLISFVNKHGHRIKFPRTIEALLEFEPDKTTLYDAVVSAGYTLFAAEAPLDLEVEIQEVSSWFDEYSDEGVGGNRIEQDFEEEGSLIDL